MYKRLYFCSNEMEINDDDIVTNTFILSVLEIPEISYRSF